MRINTCQSLRIFFPAIPFFRLFSCGFLAVFSLLATAAELRVAETADPGSFALAGDGRAAAVLIDAGDARVVRIVAEAFAGDVRRVTGQAPQVLTDPAQAGPVAVIAGTLGHSAVIDRLVQDKRVEVTALRGAWETFLIQPVANPLPGVTSGLLVIGSDRRGTAYGLFELSRRIGVSPWVWWADAVPATRKALYLSGSFQSKPPAVKYRGIFLNDEDWGLQPWAAKTFEPETKDIGPKTYAAIFELLLRLRANHCWPAMHGCTHAFNFYPKNKEVADDYAIVMGSSHCEQMLRNNVDEWKRDGAGPWDWGKNREKVLAYWRDRVAANGRYENVWTLGMRGIHDSGMEGVKEMGEKVQRMEEIFTVQRGLLKELATANDAAIPQALIPYKEVLDIYRHGLRVPDDVTLVWPDDNHGWIRHVPDAAEIKRAGGSGIYYHISYLGSPSSYVWLDSTAPAKINHEMTKALENDCKRLWIVNVGDLKPMEWGLTYFLDLAWDPARPELADQRAWLTGFAKEVFGPELAGEIADIRDGYYRLNVRCRPEHLGNEKNWKNPMRDPFFDPWHDGDEVTCRLDAWKELEARAAALETRVPANRRDAYYQLLLYPVRGAAAMNEKILAAWRSRLAAKAGLPAANLWADRAEAGYKRITEATRRYNEEMAGGKWLRMMSSTPYFKSEKTTINVYSPPVVARVVAQPGGASSLVVMPEGGGEPVKTAATLPSLVRGVVERRFLDLYSSGNEPVPVAIAADQPWIRLDRQPASIGAWERLWVSIDWAAVPAAGTGIIRIAAAGQEVAVTVHAETPPANLPAGTVPAVDGVARLAAATAVRRDGQTLRWRLVDGLGWNGAACAALGPTSAPALNDPASLRKQAPSLTWQVLLPAGKQVVVRLHAPPTQPFNAEHRLRCAVAIDDGAPVWIDIKADDEYGPLWGERVQVARMTGEVKLPPVTAGVHAVTVFGTDPSLSVDAVEVVAVP